MVGQSPRQTGEPQEGVAERDADGAIDPVRFAAGLVSAAVVILGLYYGQDILIPLAVAFLIGFALNPPVNWLTKRCLPRVL
jgi:predicted PurR-regulated permease PerM